MKTYREVARDCGLSLELTRAYIAYMTMRWGGDEEETQCKTGYVAEWARRFQNGRAYAASDMMGRDLLKLIAPELCD